MSYQGQNASAILVPQFKTIKFARNGYDYSHATEAGAIGLREPLKVSIKEKSNTDHRQRNLADRYHVTAEGDLLQTDLGTLRAFLLYLSTAPHCLQANSVDNKALNFIKNTAAAGAAANGSQQLGLTTKLTIDNKKRALNAKWESDISVDEADWLAANMTATAAAVPATGGSGTGIGSGLAYSRGAYIPSGFRSVTIGGEDVGFLGAETKLEIETVQADRDDHDRPINKWLMVTYSVVLLQGSETEMVQSFLNQKSDLTTVFTTNAGEAFKMSNGAVTIVPSPNYGEDKINITLEGKGRIPLLSTYVDFTAANTLDLKFV